MPAADDVWHLLGAQEWIVLDDPKLKGWATPRIQVPKGSTVSNLEVLAEIVQDGAFKIPKLSVMFDMTLPNGSVRRRTVSTFKPQKWPLDNFRGLENYIKHLAPNGEIELLDDLLYPEWMGDLEKRAADEDADFLRSPHLVSAMQTKKGPLLKAETIREFIELHALRRAVAESEQVTLSGLELIEYIDQAYRMGWQVREGQVPLERASSGGAKSGAKRTKMAQAWWPAGAAWAQTLIEQFHKGAWPQGRRLNLNNLALEMYDRWTDRNFEGGPDEFEPSYQYKWVLPKWRDKGWLAPTFPPNPAKKNPVQPS